MGPAFLCSVTDPPSEPSPEHFPGCRTSRRCCHTLAVGALTARLQLGRCTHPIHSEDYSSRYLETAGKHHTRHTPLTRTIQCSLSPAFSLFLPVRVSRLDECVRLEHQLLIFLVFLHSPVVLGLLTWNVTHVSPKPSEFQAPLNQIICCPLHTCFCPSLF